MVKEIEYVFKEIDKNLLNEPVAELESDFKLEISKTDSNDLVLVFANEFNFVWDKLLQFVDRNHEKSWKINDVVKNFPRKKP